MRLTPILCAMLALAACQKSAQPQANQSAAGTPEMPVKGVDRSHKGTPIPAVEILDAMSIDDPASRTDLSKLPAGKPMLLNLWASWCAPCVKELPTLQKLQDQRGGALMVVPISQDNGPQHSVEAFLNRLKLDFVAFQDPKMEISGKLGAEVLPTSILYDAQGKEVWRYVGDQDWTSPAAAKLLAEGGVSKGS